MSRYSYQIIDNRRVGTIDTEHGIIHTPTFMPVTTFGDKFPLDKLVQPYLKRLSECLMVSYHYAKQMKTRPNMPLFVDSGGFASLFKGSEVVKHKDHSCIKNGVDEELHPLDVLRFQENNADIGATLDFIIPPNLDISEAKARQKATIQNALFALRNKQEESLLLYASLQCWDEQSARDCAKEYCNAGFDGIAIGGLVPRIKDPEYVKRIVSVIREEAPNIAIHAFGIGKVELLSALVQIGIDSTDSSSYIRSAINASGVNRKHLNGPLKAAGPHAPLICALENIKKSQVALNT